MSAAPAMRRRRVDAGRPAPVRRVPAVLAAVALPLVTVACATPRSDPRVGTGWISHTLCSQVFVSGLHPDQVYADTIEPVRRPAVGRFTWIVRRHVDTARREVRTTLLGAFESRAIHRAGLGCLTVHDPAPAETSGAVGLDATPSLLAEIAGPEVVEPRDGRLREALDGAFAEPSGPPYRRTTAVVVVHDGRIIAERYAPGYGVDTPLFGYSDTKSVVSALIGILVREGRLVVDRPAPVAAWQDPADPRRAITIDHLLRMTSGLAWKEPLSGAAPGADSDRMSFRERDMARYAESRPLEAPPGTRWRYSSGNR
ncbi:MAG: serine hydrolase [Candidatus Rokubacteria bacterium]|nr:serine hydrolase [Candidatus Rokubacteria bacterium]